MKKEQSERTFIEDGKSTVPYIVRRKEGKKEKSDTNALLRRKHTVRVLFCILFEGKEGKYE